MSTTLWRIVKSSRYGRLTTMRTFGENLKEERKKKGILQKDLAEWLDVKPNTIWRWECGDREPHASKVRKMAEIFGVTVSYLMRDSDAVEGQCVEIEEKTYPKKIPVHPVVENRSPVPGTEIFGTLGVLIGQLHNDYAKMTPADQRLTKEMLMRCMRIAFGDKWVDDFIGIDKANAG